MEGRSFPLNGEALVCCGYANCALDFTCQGVIKGVYYDARLLSNSSAWPQWSHR
jgi:hypothetical protein